ERGHAVHRLVVDEDRAEKGLLGFDVVGGFAKRHRAVGLRSLTELVGGERNGVCHGATLAWRRESVERQGGGDGDCTRYSHLGEKGLECGESDGLRDQRRLAMSMASPSARAEVSGSALSFRPM